MAKRPGWQDGIGRISDSSSALLAAALLDGSAAVDAFHLWRSQTDFLRHHDQAQARLLPLLYRNMVRAGLSDPVMGHLKTRHRLSWGQSQRRLRALGLALDVLAKADIPVMVLKGMAMGQGYYDDFALRPMEDIDVLVQPEHAAQAISCLSEIDWITSCPLPNLTGAVRRAYLARYRSADLARQDAPGIDLHWRPIMECQGVSENKRVWARAEPVTLAGHAVFRPGPTDMLLHTIAHGMRPNVFSPVRWVADAAITINEYTDQIQWDTLRATARRMRLSQRIALGLSHLAPFVPQHSIPKLGQGRSLIEWLELRAFAHIEGTKDYENAIDHLYLSNKMRFYTFSSRSDIQDVLSDVFRRRLNRPPAGHDDV